MQFTINVESLSEYRSRVLNQTMDEIAAKARVNITTVWHVEKGLGCRKVNERRLIKAYGLSEEEFQQLRQLRKGA